MSKTEMRTHNNHQIKKYSAKRQQKKKEIKWKRRGEVNQPARGAWHATVWNNFWHFIKFID